jgi:hypothetical protein
MNLPSLIDRDGALRWQLWRVLPLTAVLGLAAGPAGEPAADGSTRAPKVRILSPHLKAAISSSLPNYAPPTSPDANAPVAVDTANVVVLDPMIVTDERPLVAAEWDMLTNLGRADYLKKRYKGATVPGDALTESTPNYATLMHREEVRLQRLKELDDITMDLRLAKDPAVTRKLKREIQRAQFRRSDSLTESMDKSHNNNRR